MSKQNKKKSVTTPSKFLVKHWGVAVGSLMPTGGYKVVKTGGD
jgi:hypothetical protein